MPQVWGGIKQQVASRKSEYGTGASALVFWVATDANGTATADGRHADAGASAQENEFSGDVSSVDLFGHGQCRDGKQRNRKFGQKGSLRACGCFRSGSRGAVDCSPPMRPVSGAELSLGKSRAGWIGNWQTAVKATLAGGQTAILGRFRDDGRTRCPVSCSEKMKLPVSSNRSLFNPRGRALWARDLPTIAGWGWLPDDLADRWLGGTVE